MYTAAEYRQIRQTCMKDFRALLSYLNIEMPDFEDGDEYELYEELDGEINEAICDLLKTDSVVEGYINLLNFGGIQFSFDESEADLLDKIIANRNRILRGIENYALSHHDDDDDEDEDDDDDDDEDEDEDDDDDEDEDEEEEEKPYDGRKRFFQNLYLVIGGVVALVFSVGFLILGGGDFFAVLLTLGGIVLVGFGTQGLVGTDVNARLDSAPVRKSVVKQPTKNDSFMTVMEFNQMFRALQTVQRINSKI